MKKYYLVILCCLLLALPCVSIHADETEIELLEMIHLGGLNEDSPLDDSMQTPNEPPRPNQFHAYITGHTLTVMSDATPTTQIIVRNRLTNKIVVSRQFLAIDTEQLSAGSYSVELKCVNLTLVGQFDAE